MAEDKIAERLKALEDYRALKRDMRAAHWALHRNKWIFFAAFMGGLGVLVVGTFLVYTFWPQPQIITHEVIKEAPPRIVEKTIVREVPKERVVTPNCARDELYDTRIKNCIPKSRCPPDAGFFERALACK